MPQASPTSAYLLAVRDSLRTFLGVGNSTQNELTCEVTPDGRPHPMAGEEYYAVHPSPTLARNQQTSQVNYTDELIDLSVTYTRRVSASPLDRFGADELLSPATSIGNGIPTTGILDRARSVAVHLTKQSNAYTVMGVANTNLGNVTGFREPLKLSSINWLGEKGPDWFSAEGGSDGDNGMTPPCGYAVEIRLAGARRVADTGSDMV